MISRDSHTAQSSIFEQFTGGLRSTDEGQLVELETRSGT